MKIYFFLDYFLISLGIDNNSITITCICKRYQLKPNLKFSLFSSRVIFFFLWRKLSGLNSLHGHLEKFLWKSFLGNIYMTVSHFG